MLRTSPLLSLSRKQTPLHSTSCRTTSNVAWSPHLFTSGMARSSTKTVMLLPAGGPKFLPPCLSSSPSTAAWNMPGVVALEKLIFLSSMLSGRNVSKNAPAVEDFAVPDPPATSTGVRRLWQCVMRATPRHVSVVGTRTVDQSSTSFDSRAKASGAQRSHSIVSGFTEYSKMDSPSATSRGMFAAACAGPLRSQASHFRRSSASRRPATPHDSAKSTKRSSSSAASFRDSESSAVCSTASIKAHVASTRPTREAWMGMVHSDAKKSNATPRLFVATSGS
mmetsp:Transcript_12418/g.43887  ORF Transcript_12418/g.43887 Transcript_12418/m.43887 type:complete len:279 (-) Transcript_12418:392-1228(-)